MYVDLNISSGNLVTQGGNCSLPISFKTSGDVNTLELGDFTMDVKITNYKRGIRNSSPIAAARAYDTAVFYLRGPTARLNFPDSIGEDGYLQDLSAASIRKKATEVGAKVDALQTHSRESNYGRVCLNPDLNEYPSPESSDEN
ncbi:ethylene-responsive transcription factor ERF010-like protein [Tanacetum coccineum]